MSLERRGGRRPARNSQRLRAPTPPRPARTRRGADPRRAVRRPALRAARPQPGARADRARRRARGEATPFFPRVDDEPRIAAQRLRLHRADLAQRPLRDAGGRVAARQLPPDRSAAAADPRRPAAPLLPRLPGCSDEPLAGLPRVYGIAWAFVAHTDSAFDEDLFTAFLQRLPGHRELTLGELWALPTTLRVVLIENLRRLAERIAEQQGGARGRARRLGSRPRPFRRTTSTCSALLQAAACGELPDADAQRLPVEHGDRCARAALAGPSSLPQRPGADRATRRPRRRPTT